VFLLSETMGQYQHSNYGMCEVI